MMKAVGKITTARILSQAQKIASVWEANPTFVMGTVTKDGLNAAITSLLNATATVESKRTEMTGLMNGRDDAARALSDLITRARSGVRAAFGTDSPEYEQVGGIRKSERKTRRRSTSSPSSKA